MPVRRQTLRLDGHTFLLRERAQGEVEVVAGSRHIANIYPGHQIVVDERTSPALHGTLRKLASSVTVSEPPAPSFTGHAGGFMDAAFSDSGHTRGRKGRRGHADGSAPAPASVIMNTPDYWQPSVFIPADDFTPGERLPSEHQRLFSAARGAVLVHQDEIVAARAKAQAFLERQRVKGDPAKIKEGEDEVRRIEKQIARPPIQARANELLASGKIFAASDHSWISGAALFVEESGNEKIMGYRKTATTYTSIEASCPGSCILKYERDAQGHIRVDAHGRKVRGKCYAQLSNNILPIVQMLDRVAEALNETAVDVSKDEARVIAAAFPKGMRKPTDLRIHTAGDTRTAQGARWLTQAVLSWKSKQLWKHVATESRVDEEIREIQGALVTANAAIIQAEMARGLSVEEAKREASRKIDQNASFRGETVSIRDLILRVNRLQKEGTAKKLTQPPVAWTYTHAWHSTSREDWGIDHKQRAIISVLASVQSLSELKQATGAGWAPAIVVPPGYFAKYCQKGPNGYYKAFPIEGTDFQFIPCPAQHPKPKEGEPDLRVGCVNCRLCLDDRARFRARRGIAFEAHGSGKAKTVNFIEGEAIVQRVNAHAVAEMAAEQAAEQVKRGRRLTVLKNE